MSATGPASYFKEITSPTNSEISLTVSYPFSKKCPPISVTVDAHGLIEYNMTLLNHSIPYTMRILASRKNYNPIVFDYFVGGYPIISRVEMGTYSFYTADTQSKINAFYKFIFRS